MVNYFISGKYDLVDGFIWWIFDIFVFILRLSLFFKKNILITFVVEFCVLGESVIFD